MKKLDIATVEAGEEMANILTEVSAGMLLDKAVLPDLRSRGYSDEYIGIVADYVGNRRTSVECIYCAMLLVELGRM